MIIDPTKCLHERLPLPAFDKEACKDKDADWVRKHYPRGYVECPDCKQKIIAYASFEHYIAGDY